MPQSVPPATTFDEIAYLEANPDALVAVGSGQFESDRDHYFQHGKAENRPLRVAAAGSSGGDHDRVGYESGSPLGAHGRGLFTAPNQTGRLRLLDLALGAVRDPSVRMAALAPLSRPEIWLDNSLHAQIDSFLAVDRHALGAEQGPGAPGEADALIGAVLGKATRSEDNAQMFHALGVHFLLTNVDARSDALAFAAFEAAANAGGGVPSRYGALVAASRQRVENWRQHMFLAAAGLADAPEPCRTEARARLAVLLTELGQFDTARSHARTIAKADGPALLAEFLLALADVMELETIPLAHRGFDGAAIAGTAQRHLERLSAAKVSGLAISLLSARFHLLTGSYDRAFENARAALAVQSTNSAAHWFAGASAQHVGDLQTALGHYLEILRESRNDAVSRRADHVRHWMGADDHFVRSMMRLSDDPPPPPTHTRDLVHIRRLPLIVLADHDFDLTYRLRLEYALSEPCILLRTTHPFALQLVVERGGVARILLGDGRHWIIDFSSRGGDVPAGRDVTIVLRRRGDRLILVGANGVGTEQTLPRHFGILGDTIGIGETPHLGAPLPFVPLGLRCDIARYADVAPARHVCLYSAFYGELFGDMIARTMLPSLLSPLNLPALQGDHEIVNRIYCRSQEAEMMAPYLRSLDVAGIAWTLDTAILDANSDAPRSQLADTFIDAVEETSARNGILVMAPPDHVFGHGLANLVRGLDPNGYLVAGHPRVSTERAFHKFSELLGFPEIRENGVANQLLVRLAMEAFPHAVTQTGLMHREPFWNADREGPDYRVRFREPPPLMMHARPDILNVVRGDTYAPSFETIDHDLVDYMARTGRLRIIDDSRVFFWAEYCLDSRNQPSVRNDYWSVTARNLASTELNWHGASEKPVIQGQGDLR